MRGSNLDFLLFNCGGSTSLEMINRVEDNIKELKASLKAANTFRTKLTQERSAFESYINKLEIALKSAGKIGLECNERKFFTPKDIAEFYLLK